MTKIEPCPYPNCGEECVIVGDDTDAGIACQYCNYESGGKFLTPNEAIRVHNLVAKYLKRKLKGRTFDPADAGEVSDELGL